MCMCKHFTYYVHVHPEVYIEIEIFKNFTQIYVCSIRNFFTLNISRVTRGYPFKCTMHKLSTT